MRRSKGLRKGNAILVVDGIVYEELGALSHQDHEILLKSSLHAHVENMEIGDVGETLTYGNKGGLRILESLRQLERDRQKADAKFKVLEDLLERHDREIFSQKAQIRILTTTSKGYNQIRRRFLEVYKRDAGLVSEPGYSSAIVQGNMAAHHGDALSDAMIYEQDHRTDERVYQQLYGLDHTKVLEINLNGNRYDILSVLNAHATRLAQKKPLTVKAEMAFDNFIARVKEFWLCNPTEDSNSPLGRAYYEFWMHHNSNT